MSEQPCRFEDAVTEAARTGAWSHELRAHVCECAQCAETESLTAWMGSVAAHLGGSEAPPDPMLIWLKGELAKREQSAARASRLAALLSTVPVIVLSLIASFAGVRAWSSAPAFTEAARNWFWSSLVPGLPGGSATALTLGIAIPLMVAAAYLFAYRPMQHLRG